MSAIVTRGLTKIYKAHVMRPVVRSLDNLNIEVGRNEVFGFLGRNGAGKTTTIKLLCGLLRPTSGDAFIMGRSVRSPESRRGIGYLPENPYFYEYLTPHETLDFYGQLGRLSTGERKREWERISALLDLRSIADERVRSFSKGMRQRLGFAVALTGNPEMLILDEPMSGLDPLQRRSFRELILRLRDEGKTIFFSSHVLGDVEQICDRVGILVKGRLTVQGRIDELLTGKIARVEVIVSGLVQSAIESLAARSDSVRHSEAGHHFLMPDVDSANELVREAQRAGGTLIEFTPVKESLEDYFVRKQEPAP